MTSSQYTPTKWLVSLFKILAFKLSMDITEVLIIINIHDKNNVIRNYSTVRNTDSVKSKLSTINKKEFNLF